MLYRAMYITTISINEKFHKLIKLLIFFHILYLLLCMQSLQYQILPQAYKNIKSCHKLIKMPQAYKITDALNFYEM